MDFCFSQQFNSKIISPRGPYDEPVSTNSYRMYRKMRPRLLGLGPVLPDEVGLHDEAGKNKRARFG